MAGRSKDLTLRHKVLDTRKPDAILSLPMSSVGPLRSRSPEPIRLDARAADNLRYIREAMERAGEFTAVPGWGGLAMGCTALVAAGLAARQHTPNRWLLGWLSEACVAVAVTATAAARKAGRARLPLFSGPGRKFALSFVPPVFVGALLTVVLFHAGLIAALPGMWLLLYWTSIAPCGACSGRVVPG